MDQRRSADDDPPLSAGEVQTGEVDVKKLLVGVAVSAVALGFSAVAFAGSSAILVGYAGVGGKVQSKVSSPTGHVLGAGTLPFTGFGLALIALAAMALLGTGWALRRVSRKQQ